MLHWHLHSNAPLSYLLFALQLHCAPVALALQSYTDFCAPMHHFIICALMALCAKAILALIINNSFIGLAKIHCTPVALHTNDTPPLRWLCCATSRPMMSTATFIFERHISNTLLEILENVTTVKWSLMVFTYISVAQIIFETYTSYFKTNEAVCIEWNVPLNKFWCPLTSHEEDLP